MRPHRLVSSVHGIFQARKLEQATISFSRGSSWLRDSTCVSCITDGFFYCWARFKLWYLYIMGFPGGSVVRNLPASAGHMGLIPQSGGSPGEGNDNPFYYSCLDTPMDIGVWQAIVYGVTMSWTWLSDWPCIHLYIIDHVFKQYLMTLKNAKIKMLMI